MQQKLVPIIQKDKSLQFYVRADQECRLSTGCTGHSILAKKWGNELGASDRGTTIMMTTVSKIRFRDQGLALSVTAGLHIALIAWLCTVEMHETLAET